MSEESKMFWCSVLFYIAGFIVSGFIFYSNMKEEHGIINNAIEDCEKSLPRDQYCDWRVETIVKDKEEK